MIFIYTSELIDKRRVRTTPPENSGDTERPKLETAHRCYLGGMPLPSTERTHIRRQRYCHGVGRVEGGDSNCG